MAASEYNGGALSYELMGIILLGFGRIVSLLATLRGLREISRIQRALAGLLVQESDRVQALIRQSAGP